jgi:hypothetical protein
MGWDVRRTRCARPRPAAAAMPLGAGPLGDPLQQLSSCRIKVPEVSASKIRVVDRASGASAIRRGRASPEGRGVLPHRCLRVNTAQDPRSLDGEIICLNRRGESSFTP